LERAPFGKLVGNGSTENIDARLSVVIATRLSGGLGNNLFGYAISRLAAERAGFEFCYFPPRSTTSAHQFRNLMNRVRGGIKSLIVPRSAQEPTSHPLQTRHPKQTAKADLADYFELSPVPGPWGRRCLQRRWEREMSFQEAEANASPGYDGQWVELEDWTEIQPPTTFAGLEAHRRTVCEWYTPRPNYQKLLDEVEQQIPVPPEKRCCLHIRHGDFLWHDKGYAYQDQGWALPWEYYQHVLKMLPEGLHYLVVTDDPEYAREKLAAVKCKTLIEGNPDPVDLLSFTLCKYNVVANSTFSMWGAWLNDTPDKEVWAPEFNLGWHKREWMPAPLGWSPPAWCFVDVLGLMKTEA
jgi:hypothetical protein